MVALLICILISGVTAKPALESSSYQWGVKATGPTVYQDDFGIDTLEEEEGFQDPLYYYYDENYGDGFDYDLSDAFDYDDYYFPTPQDPSTTTSTTLPPPAETTDPVLPDSSTIQNNNETSLQDDYNRNQNLSKAMEVLVDKETDYTFSLSTTSTISPTSSSTPTTLPPNTRASHDISNPKGTIIGISIFIITLFCIIIFCISLTVRRAVFNACERCYRSLPDMVNTINCFRRGQSPGIPYSAPLISRFQSSTSSVYFESSFSQGGEGRGTQTGDEVDVGGGGGKEGTSTGGEGGGGIQSDTASQQSGAQTSGGRARLERRGGLQQPAKVTPIPKTPPATGPDTSDGGGE